MAAGGAARLHALDGLRGVLALVVVAQHVALMLGSDSLFWAGRLSVLAFFAMSGLVLTKAYDGRFGAFLLRRAVRLMPVYLVCYAVGIWLNGLGRPIDVDLPMWSLNFEFEAMFIFPAIVWTSRSLVLTAIACAWLAAASFPAPGLGFFIPFLAGAYAVRFAWTSPALERAVPQWLGKVSYSLYLSHWLVLEALGLWGLVVVLPVAWALWWCVERPSIAWSRRVGHALA